MAETVAAEQTTTPEVNGRKHNRKPEGVVRCVIDLTEAQMLEVKRCQVKAWEKAGYKGDMISIADVLVGALAKGGVK